MPVVVNELHDRHESGVEVWVGVETAGTELPARADLIREALARTGARFVQRSNHPDSELRRVHDSALTDYLATASEAWSAQGLPEEPGQPLVVPYIFPTPAMLEGRPSVSPAAASARAGLFAYDTMTPVGAGTWEAARGAVDAALTAADLVLGGERAAYALTRPPGHHATRSGFGGSCYLNNAAVAAAHLRAALGARVAVLDIDAHHGNGTQEIFYDDPWVLTGSVHVDPGAGWFPHFLGFAGERGRDEGAGANLNLPLAPGCGDRPWLDAVGRLAAWAAEHGAAALIVALGVDAAAADPESPLAVTAAGYRAAAARLAEIGVPTVIVQEGGYDLATIGSLVRESLLGFET